MSEVRYMISETAKQVDVEAHVLRYWEEELALAIDRNEMGHRYYTEDDITLFKNIKELKEQGFQLKAIKMLLPELRKQGGCSMDKLLEKREELNLAAEAQTDGGAEQPLWDPVRESAREEYRAELAQAGSTAETDMAENTKLQQFQMIFGNIVLQALKENNQELSSGISEQVSEQVSDSVLKEMDYLMRVREEREDERFKKLDETIRLTQRSRKEAAAARVEEKRMKRLQKKEKKKRRGFGGFGRKTGREL